MSMKQAVFGERSLTKIAGLFRSRDGAESAAMQLSHIAGMDESQVKLVGPADGVGAGNVSFARKLEPEQSGIWHTLLRAHAFAGAIGAVLGALLFLVLVFAGNPAVLSTPGMSLVAMVFFGTLFGLLVGGALTLRPDHARVIAAVREAIRQGYWAVVIHPVNQYQIDLALNELNLRCDRVVRTL